MALGLLLTEQLLLWNQIHLWEPSEGGTWDVGAAAKWHTVSCVPILMHCVS